MKAFLSCEKDWASGVQEKDLGLPQSMVVNGALRKLKLWMKHR